MIRSRDILFSAITSLIPKTPLLKNEADLRIIQELLKDAHIATTDRYTHVSRKHLHTAFEKFHPKFS
ncbi:MAG: hypothetical protein QRY71_03620 [Candidatus Rhabdochlamydia sp.]